jgi:transcriptional regulator with XRE-family HTH domain
MEIKKLIGKRIKELRQNKKLSQEALAERADINAKYISRIELGMENPTLDLFIKLSKALKVEMWEMFDFHHQVNDKELRKLLYDQAKTTDPQKLRIAFKIIRALTR